MSLTSTSEPPILATQIEVLENLEETEPIESYVRNRLLFSSFITSPQTELHHAMTAHHYDQNFPFNCVPNDDLTNTIVQKPTRKEASVKRLHGNVATTSTVSETSDYSSSLLWTPAQPMLKQVKEKVGMERSIFPPAQKRMEILSQARLRNWV